MHSLFSINNYLFSTIKQGRKRWSIFWGNFGLGMGRMYAHKPLFSARINLDTFETALITTKVKKKNKVIQTGQINIPSSISVRPQAIISLKSFLAWSETCLLFVFKNTHLVLGIKARKEGGWWCYSICWSWHSITTLCHTKDFGRINATHLSLTAYSVNLL